VFEAGVLTVRRRNNNDWNTKLTVMESLLKSQFRNYYKVIKKSATLFLAWTIRGSNPDGGEIFRTRPDRPWGPPSLLYNVYRVYPGDKAARAWCWQPSPPNAEVENE
jgi:hypothetical protein